MYGTDLQECLHTMMTSLTSQINSNVNTTRTTKRPFATTHALQRLLNFTTNMVVDTSDPGLVDVLNRFLLYIPHVVFATKQASDLGENGFVRMRVPHPMGHGVGRQRVLIEEIGQCAKAYGFYILKDSKIKRFKKNLGISDRKITIRKSFILFCSSTKKQTLFLFNYQFFF